MTERDKNLDLPTLMAKMRDAECLVLWTAASAENAAAPPPALEALRTCINDDRRSELAVDLERDCGFPVRSAGVPTDTLRWIEAGALYEKVLALLPARSFRYVVCLDLWTACFRTAAEAIYPGATWIYIEGAPPLSTRDKDTADYMRAMPEWVAALPFDYTIASEALTEHLGVQGAPRTASPRPSTSVPPTLELVPAAEKRSQLRVTAAPPASAIDLSILVVYPDSLPRFRVFMDSVMALGLDRLELVVGVTTTSDDLSEFLRAIRLARPDWSVHAVAVSGSRSALWQQMARIQGPTRTVVALLDGNSILPKDFADSVRRVSQQHQALSFRLVVLGTEVSAHVIAGNLDPAPHYESLCAAFGNRRVLSTSEREFPQSYLVAGSLLHRDADLRAALADDRTLASTREPSHVSHSKVEDRILLRLAEV